MNFNHKFLRKIFPVISLFSIFLQSLLPYLGTISTVRAQEKIELKSEIEFNKNTNSFTIGVNTKEKVKYSILYKSTQKIESEIKGASSENETKDFEEKDLYAGIISGEDQRKDEVIRGIYKVQVQSANWVSAIKFSLDNNQLKEEGKKEYEPDSLYFEDKEIRYSDEELNWINKGDIISPTPSSGEILEKAASIERDLTPTITSSIATPEIDTEVIESYQCMANSLNGCVVTDKEDYTPNEIVFLTGHGFIQNTPYVLRITSQTGLFENEFNILTDENGSFSYSYQLDGTYRPDYLVEVKNIDGTVITSTTFTDHYNFKVYINNNDTTTNSLDVNLDLSWETFPIFSPDPVFIRYANDTTLNNGCWSLGAGSWTDWQTMSDQGGNTYTTNWTLASGGSGVRKVCVETAHPLFLLSSILLDADKINYEAPKGSITIVKEANVEDGEDFGFSGTLGAFNLDDDNDGTLSNSKAFTNLLANQSYEITEDIVSGWELSSINCEGASSLQTDVVNRKVNINLNNNEDVICTFNNTKEVSSVKVCKFDSDNNALSNWRIGLVGQSIGVFSVPADGSVVSKNYITGDYVLTATGTYNYGNSQMQADAANSFRFTNLPCPPSFGFNDWVNGEVSCMNNYLSLNFSTTGSPAAPGWGNFYNPEHKYLQNFTGGNLDLKIWDSCSTSGEGCYGDNEGSLQVNVNQGFAGDTKEDGCITFDNVPYGEYELQEVLQQDWAKVSGEGNILINEQSETFTLINQYSPRKGSISGHKFQDKDDSASFSAGDQYESNWTINIYKDGQQDEFSSDTTDNNGLYNFSELTPGKYFVCEEAKEGWLQTYPETGAPLRKENTNCHELTLNAGQNIVNIDFGNKKNPVIIKAQKLVCDSEKDLPNWGDSSGGFVDENTAYKYATESNGKCDLVSDWDFEWGFDGSAPKQSGEFVGYAGTPWHAFDSKTGSGTTAAQAVIYDLNKSSRIWVREVLKNGYIPFTYPPQPSPGSNISAEFYCHTDHYKYDNYESIESPQYGQTYYCVGLNVLNYGKITVDKITNPSGNLTNFEFTIANDSGTVRQFNLRDQDGQESTEVLAGTYSVVESPDSNWQNSNITCLSNLQSSDEKTLLLNKPEYGLIKPVYAQLSSNLDPNNLTVSSGEEITCTFTNDFIPSIATIAKINNKYPAEQLPGDTVQYTIFLKVLDNDLINAKVVDLPPGGFKYIPGSYKVYKGSTDITSQIPEPLYASPGTWELGNLEKDDELKLTYLAQIDNNLDLGLYKDMAYAYGCSELSQNEDCILEGGAEDVILAVSRPSGGIDQGILSSNYVGTQVALNKDTTLSTSVNVEKEEERENVGSVLGASTSLPKTGAKTITTKTMAIIFILSFLSLLALNLGKKSFVALILLVLISLFRLPNMAFSGGYLSVRLENPKSPTNNNTFSIGFTTMDMTGSTITAKCFKKGPTESVFTQFGNNINIISGGNSGACKVSESIMSTGGTYQFLVKATSSSDSKDSEIVTVDYNTEGPGTPTSYSKTKINNGCEYKIIARSAKDNGKTTFVELYRSDSLSFSADSKTRVHTFNIGSDVLIDHTNSVPDCSKNYYYALKAFDNYGNGSGIVGDENIKIKIVGATSTQTSSSPENLAETQGAIELQGAGNILGSEIVEEKNLNEDQTQEQRPEEQEQGEVLGAAKTKNLIDQIISFIKENPLLSFAVVFGLALISYASAKVIKTKKTTN